ncbi:MAG TPA: zf-HC2 domain-containing protein [Pyrinomonadaceae bacterium]|nr:zf-HC2 domain-containing protein [Pyrinomonadaceae bacterium]
MFSRHVTKDISAYCHGELSSEESKQFAEHIFSCTRCRTKYEEVKLGIKLAEQLPQLSAPEHLWRNLEHLLDKQTETAVDGPSLSRSSFWTWRIQMAAAVALLLIAGAGALWIYTSRPTVGPTQSDGPKASWLVRRLDGTPRIGSETIAQNGRLAIGDWLETDGSSRAQIAVGSIGNVDIDENTRVRLLANEPTEHRLELARGKMSARIWAPPRLFFVDTPSAVAADLGCAYTLEVDENGGSILHVTSGWVALQLKDRESIVPAGAACETQPGIGPGTPYFVDSTQPFRDALKKIDFNDDGNSQTAALTSMLDQARQRDTLTLWHLLPRVNGEDRARVYDKLAAFAPPPAGVTREGVLRLDRTMLDTWRQTLEPQWIGTGKGLLKTKDDWLWKLKKGVSPKMKEMMPK